MECLAVKRCPFCSSHLETKFLLLSMQEQVPT